MYTTAWFTVHDSYRVQVHVVVVNMSKLNTQQSLMCDFKNIKKTDANMQVDRHTFSVLFSPVSLDWHSCNVSNYI